MSDMNNHTAADRITPELISELVAEAMQLARPPPRLPPPITG